MTFSLIIKTISMLKKEYRLGIEDDEETLITLHKKCGVHSVHGITELRKLAYGHVIQRGMGFQLLYAKGVYGHRYRCGSGATHSGVCFS